MTSRRAGLGQAALIFGAAFLGFCAFWYGMFWVAQAAGFNLQSTPEYGFSSGIGPMILTAILGASVITGMWHGHNCHQDGCLRYGRHRVNGTPWCNVHHENARPYVSDNELLQQILAKLDELK